MRVVHAVRSHVFAGVERYVASVAPLLAARGVDIRVIGGEPAQMRRSMGDGVAHRGATTTAGVAWALAEIGRADIVHVHMTAAEVAGVATAARHRGALISTRHFCGSRGESIAGRIASPIIRRRLTQQISVSQFVADSIDEPSVVLANGVPRSDRGPHRAKTVLVLQRLEREKQTELALRAWSRATPKDAGWLLEIAGDGSLMAELVALAASLGVAETVRFVGHLDNVSERLAAAGVLLATAPFEPFGLSVVEAMATGTAVLAARGGGHLETVGGCPAARLFTPGDIDDCAVQLGALVGGDAERAAYGEALQERQRVHFDIERHVDQLMGLYERAL